MAFEEKNSLGDNPKTCGLRNKFKWQLISVDHSGSFLSFPLIIICRYACIERFMPLTNLLYHGAYEVLDFCLKLLK